MKLNIDIESIVKKWLVKLMCRLSFCAYWISDFGFLHSFLDRSIVMSENENEKYIGFRYHKNPSVASQQSMSDMLFYDSCLLCRNYMPTFFFFGIPI